MDGLPGHVDKTQSSGDAGDLDTDIKLRETNCPVCGSVGFRVLFEDRNRREDLPVRSRYCKCSTCSAIFLNPTLDAASFHEFDEVFTTKRGGSRYPSLERLLGGASNNSIHGWLHRLPGGVGAGKKILDIGCSSGEKLVAFKKKGFQVFGVDMAADAVQKANERFGGGFVCGPVEKVQFEDNSFDYVRIDNTLEHVQDPGKSLKEAFRVLKPGGWLFVYVPNGESLSMRVLKGISTNSWIPFHVVLYTPRSLRRLLVSAGFEKPRVLTHTPPSLLLGTFSQTLVLDGGRPVDIGIWGGIASAVALPVGLVLSLLPFGEELVAWARKPSSDGYN